MIVGWNDIKATPPFEGQLVEMMDGRGVIVRGNWHRHATYNYENKPYRPTLWREPVNA